MTGNALYVSKDELNRQGYTYVYNAWVGVLHVFTVHKLRNLTFVAQFMCIVRFTICATIYKLLLAHIVNSQIAQRNL